MNNSTNTENSDNAPPSAPRLTIGMAVYDDFDGVFFTLQQARLLVFSLTEGFRPEDVEFIVVDNTPSAASSQRVRDLCGKARARYVPFSEVEGTTATRQKIFDEARGDWVMVLDSHVLLAPGALRALSAFMTQHPESRDILSGPLVDDTLGRFSTHFNDYWRSGMWGVWGLAWRAADGRAFSVIAEDGEQGGRCVYLSTIPEAYAPDHPYGRQHVLHDVGPASLPFAGHEPALVAAGCRPLVQAGDVTEVPGQGLGLFAMRRAAWPGFAPGCRGFGGEEMVIHEKVRQRGGRALCLGGLRWVHRFAVEGSIKYPRPRFWTIRNYMLGLNEIGHPLDRLKRHYVPTLCPENEWEFLVADPIHRVWIPNAPPPGAPGPMPAAPRENRPGPAAPPLLAAAPVPQPAGDPEAVRGKLFELAKSVPRDMDQHAERLRELAARCERVTDISKRKESAIFLAGGGPRSLRSYNTEAADPLLQLLLASTPGMRLESLPAKDVPAAIEPTDLLFIHDTHTYAVLIQQLRNWAPLVEKYIVLLCTQLYGQHGEGGGPGMQAAIAEFVEENPRWFVLSHDPRQIGLTVLCTLEAERPAEPVRLGKLRSGPGTELHLMLASLGINPTASCDCNSKMAQMDAWGVSGCRANRRTIIGWLHDGQKNWGWEAAIAAGWKTLTTGLITKLLTLDPLAALVDEAIRRAEAKAAANPPPKSTCGAKQ